MDVDLVLEGGGVKGIALVGAYTVLEERGYRTRRVAGSSAGAIVGSLIASQMTSLRMIEIMQTLDYTKFRDKGLLDHFGLVGRGLSVLFEKGIYEGRYLTEWLDEHLDDATFARFRDEDDDPSSATFDPQTSYRLVVMASDVSNHRLARLPWDFSSIYRTNGSASGGADARKVSEAVRCSMSIPVFYEPYQLEYHRGQDGTSAPAKAWMVDGGMLSNFPVDVFDRKGGGRPRWPTFGIKLSSGPETDLPPQSIDGPIDFARSLVATMTGFFDRVHIENPETVARTIFVDTGSIQATDFDLTEAQQRWLYEQGRRATERFLDGTAEKPAWDFERYIDTFRSP